MHIIVRSVRFACYCILAACLFGCARDRDSNHIYLRVVGGEGPAGMALAARVTSRYIVEKRFLRVSVPGVSNPTAAQENAALSAAVVQPAYRESDPDGATYLMCTVHEPSRDLARVMLGRCQGQLMEVAKAVGVVLVPAQEF